jgi:hypothetical protein
MAINNPKPEPFREGRRFLSTEALNQILRLTPRQVRGSGNLTVNYYGLDRIALDSQHLQAQLPSPDNFIQNFLVLAEDYGGDLLLCIPFQQPANPDNYDNNGPNPFEPQLYDSSVGVTTYAFTPPPADWNPSISEWGSDSLGSGTPALMGNVSNLVLVAKPYYLQMSPWTDSGASDLVLNGNAYSVSPVPGSTNQRVLSDSIGSTTQTITPNYVSGEIISAVRVLTGYSDSFAAPVILMDLNTAGRTWASSSTTSFSYDIADANGHNDPNSVGLTFNGAIVNSGGGVGNDTINAPGSPGWVIFNGGGSAGNDSFASNASFTFSVATAELEIGNNTAGKVYVGKGGATASNTVAEIGVCPNGAAANFYLGGYGSTSFASFCYPGAGAMASIGNGIVTFVKMCDDTFGCNTLTGAINSASGYWVGGTVFNAPVQGLTDVVSLAKLTTGGTNGSVTFTGGIITGYTAPS